MADNQSIVAGLFATPEQYQQAQLQQLYGNQLEQAKLSPIQQASFDIGSGFQRAGNAVGSALGAQDPMLQLQSLRAQVLKGVDQTDAKSLAAAAKTLADAGDLQGANVIAQQSIGIQAKIDEKQAARDQALQIARERIQAQIQMAEQRGADQKQIAQMRIEGQQQLAQIAAALKGQKEVNVDDKSAVRIGQNRVFDTLASEGDKLLKDIEDNKGAFSLTGRAATFFKSQANPEAPDVKAVSDVQAYLNKARNAYLLAAKGTQTEGDAQRAWQEFAGTLDFGSATGAKRSVERIQAELRTQKAANEDYLKARNVPFSSSAPSDGWSIKRK